ncbi:phenylalanyl-tRNA synthetase, beta subunit [Treponema sp. JC4]|uniref:phenylalanine--tRNA ligase subunit beta n=1 Tax=Treponema sp. JC4 TaxID=1124982 RepID=UPI00025B0C5B|nr:phenylalanine--tRNA ligase subunit beta [Treponema sp. JC4]EID84888.1 phenylalanyl-tRNA synthetase, beta subunit [Treponema sp. JC4]
MPKIECNEKLFFDAIGKKYTYDALEDVLPCAKAELDEKPDMSLPENERVVKIELNDTNRPDLWSTNGVARQIKLHEGGKTVDYMKLMTNRGNNDYADRVVDVDPELKNIRPYMVAFMIAGKPIDDPMLKDIIQTQEKLAWNFGRKRKSLSMGVYRIDQIKFPVKYHAVDPDKTSFVPLQCESPMTCRQILTDHPKGKDFGWILADKSKFPLLSDAKNEILSMAPIINSATLGAVQVGDKDLMVELTGDNIENLILSANIVACDFADQGYEIKPVLVRHPYDTGLGKDIMVPYYFQPTTKTTLGAINKLLGSDFDMPKVVDALTRMGSSVEVKGEEITLSPAPYRNDFLHEVDIIEDVMIGANVAAFPPVTPSDFTVGRLLPLTEFSRKAKTLMVGLGYQEMIFNYVGSKKDYIDNMRIDGSKVIEIANPMSENYQFIRPEILSSLLRAESGSANAVYPHKIFEIGKVAYLKDDEVTGTITRQHIGFITSAANANFNDMASEVSSLLYYLDHEYKVVETEDPRFIVGRQAGVTVNGEVVGVFGEIHPQVLENWGITTPCAGGELDLESLMATADTKTDAQKKQEAKKAAGDAAPNGGNQKSEAETNPAKYFNEHIELLVAKITKVETNPQGDKLYIETLDDGSGTERIIQSGLRPYLKEDELLGQHVIIAANLAPRKMKGVESRGMLLACDYTEDGKEKVELLTAPWAAPGTVIQLEGNEYTGEKPAKIDIDHFCKVEYRVSNKCFTIAGIKALADGKPVTTNKADNCEVC